MIKEFFVSSMKRKIYVVREGTHKGNFLVYINSDQENHNFLTLPYNGTLGVPKEQFKQGVDNKIVDYIEKLPHNVYSICCAQYNESKTKSDIDRLKQPAAQSGVDSRERKT